MPCRVNNRRMWTGRILLEASSHEFNSFVTLTIQDLRPKDHGPPARNAWELVPRDLTLYFKRLRKLFPIRYFAVGEYGSLKFRPHYHLALFGVPMTAAPVLQEAWGLGDIHVGDLTKDSAQYICGYVTKKMTSQDDPRLSTRHPEYAVMSRNPPLGSLAARTIAEQLLLAADIDDIPPTFRTHGKTFPMAKGLRRALRTELFGEPDTPPLARTRLYFEKESIDQTTREQRREAQFLSVQARLRIQRSKEKL